VRQRLIQLDAEKQQFTSRRRWLDNVVWHNVSLNADFFYSFDYHFCVGKKLLVTVDAPLELFKTCCFSVMSLDKASKHC